MDGRVWENLYDGEGLRAGIRGDGACTTFLYHNGEILAECGEDGEPVSRYVYGRGLSHVQTLRDGICHAYHCDEQGSTAYMTGPGGGVENSYRYDAFGNLLERKETVPNRILYTGQQYDQETGQYYLRARYYNPVVGRFLQEDTYHGDGLNLYAYCANNPVVYYDPGGHDSAAVMKKAEEPDLPVGVGKGSTEFAYKKELNRLKAIRKELPQSSKYQGIDGFGNPVGNVAYSTSEIRNYNIPDLKSYSKIGSLGKNGIKNPVDGWVSNVDNPRYSNLVEKVDRNNQISPNGTLKINDTEYKIIENYNRILSGDSAASGTINIFSERKICPSCEKVIKAFSNDYPNIEINVMDSFGNLYTVLGGQKLIK